MKVRLRVLHGKLQDKEGHGKGMEVKIHGPRFVIGSAADCSMCCKSRTVSPRHCEIHIEEAQAVLQSLSEETGTFVNDQRVEGRQILHDGDHLQIGRLEFQVLIDTPVPERPARGEPVSDRSEDELSDMLVEADEKERVFRMAHPEVRELHLESATHQGEEPQNQKKEGSRVKKKGKADKKKGKQEPGGLPPPPVHETADSTEAAQEALRRLFRP